MTTPVMYFPLSDHCSSPPSPPRVQISARAEWDAMLTRTKNQHPTWTVARCVSALVTADPDLHERMLDEVNDR